MVVVTLLVALRNEERLKEEYREAREGKRYHKPLCVWFNNERPSYLCRGLLDKTLVKFRQSP